MNIKAVTGTLVGAGALGAGTYSYMSHKSNAAMTKQVEGMRKAQDESQAWVTEFDKEFPDRSLDTAAQHRDMKQYLDTHPTPRIVGVTHEDVDTAVVGWNGTWPAHESGTGVMLLGFMCGGFAGTLATAGAVISATTKGSPKVTIPLAILGAAGLGGAAGTLSGLARSEREVGYLNADDVINGVS